MIDLFPGLDLAFALVAWATATYIALALWEWCTDDSQGDDR